MPPSVPPGGASPSYPSAATLKQLSDANVATWLDIGRLAEGVEDYERAKTAYEMAIKNNHDSIPAKKAIALLYKDKLKSLDKVSLPPFLRADHQAIEYLQSCIHTDNTGPGDIWALLGTCNRGISDI
jgi:tetratricopeptide (TPR) repeat protein